MKGIKMSEKGNTIKVNLIFQTMYQILIVITPLITSPYVSRALGAEGLGVYSYTFSIVNYLMIFSLLGTTNYGNRSIAIVRDDKQKMSRIFCEIVMLQFIVTSLAILIYVLYLLVYKPENFIISVIQLFYIISCYFNINWFFFGIEEFKLTVVRNFFIKIITIFCIFIFIKDPSDLWKYVLLLALGELLSQALLFSFLKKYIVWIKPTFKGVIRHLKPNLLLFIPAIAYSINNLLDKTMLGILSDYQNTGFFYNAEKLINIPTGIISGIGLVMLPRISNLISSGHQNLGEKYLYKSLNFVMLLACGLGFGIASISREFVPLFFGEEFDGSVRVVQLMSFVILFKAMADVVRTQYLIPHKEDKIYANAMLIGAVANVSINAFLIRPYGAYGAAIGTLVAEFLICGIQIWKTNQKISLIVPVFKTSLFIINGIVMLIVIRFVVSMSDIENSLLLLILEILCGTVTYIIGSILIFAVIDRAALNAVLQISKNKFLRKTKFE
ncbi:flippase [Priestia aryabhattai]